MDGVQFIESSPVYRRLCAGGRYRAEGDRQIDELDLRYQHPVKGQSRIAVDRVGLREMGRVYVGDANLKRALEDRGAVVGSWHDIYGLMMSKMSAPGVMLGVSGYATADRKYPVWTEAEAMLELYRRLVRLVPGVALVSDGASGAGILGLNGLIAQGFGLETLGFTPMEGLAKAAPRSHLVVGGNSYEDREVLVGTLPDILLCVAGGDGTLREAVAAVSAGSTVILLALQDYGPRSFASTYTGNAAIRSAVAARPRRFFCVRSVDELMTTLENVLSHNEWRRGRNHRIHTLAQLMR